MRKTFRDDLAMAALPALITSSVVEPGRIARCEIIANLAYIFADAMLEQRNKETVDNKEEQKEEENGLV
jgi:hypothetical protein